MTHISRRDVLARSAASGAVPSGITRGEERQISATSNAALPSGDERSKHADALRLFRCVALLAGLISIAGQAQPAQISYVALRQGFANPPAPAKLRCYWWWLNGNTTEETITRDLTEMSHKGFGGVLLIDANGSNQNGNANVPPGPTFRSPEWMKLYVHALKIAQLLNLEVTLNITSGWNLGGPDVTPADGSKLLTWSRTVTTDAVFDGILPSPPSRNGFYRQIAVMAYPLSHGAALPGEEGSGRAAIEDLPFKTGAKEMAFSMPRSEQLLGTMMPVDQEEDTALESVVDISAQVDAAGHLIWHAPSKGLWEILRIGYTDSDARVSTSSGAWQGLAIDYLDRGAFDTYWKHNLEPLLAVSKPYLGKTLVNLATDSWELGGTNWTGRFRDEFRKRRGYDPAPYLPVVSGRIVGDRATSERFLNDLRRTVGDLIADHYDHFAERAKVYRLGIQCESGGPHGAPMDALETFRSSAVPQTEYWGQSKEHRTTDVDRFFTKEAASAADIYGKKFVAEEGMTSIGPQWSESLATDLKPSFDRALTEGMNRLVWHEFTSSPKSFGLPGNEYFAGTHLNPNVTWWQQGDAFFRYLNRSQLLMQQGHAVDDVLYFYGDEVPNFVRLKLDDPAHVLPGYDYDVTNEDALLHTLQLHDGVISSLAGNRYRLLVLPSGRRMSLASLERIASYVREGGSIVGESTLAPTGLLDSSSAERFVQLANAMWHGCATGSVAYGKGTVFCSSDTRAALAALNVPPDFEDASAQLDYVHRVDGSRDIYFVRNTTAHAVDAVARFRVARRTPELWNAVDGSIKPQLYFNIEETGIDLPMHLEGYGSVFVVFENSPGPHVTHVYRGSKEIDSVQVTGRGLSEFTLERANAGKYRFKLSDGRELTAEAPAMTNEELKPSRWTITYQPERGAPTGSQQLQNFQSWTESVDPGVRYFSGTATYRTTVYVKRVNGEHVLLTLSDLREICTVRVNGKRAGTIWAMPYRLDVTAALANGSNVLELEVTNLWPNRIIGDAQPSIKETFTNTNIRKYNAESPLLPSGLIGPVAIEKIDQTPLHFVTGAEGPR